MAATSQKGDVEKAFRKSSISLSSSPVGDAVDRECDSEAKLVFPDGGKVAWMAVLAGFLVQYTNLGYVTSYGVYQDYYARSYLTSYPPSAIGWVGGIQVFLTFTSGVITGHLFDMGYFHSLMITSTILHALALLTLSVSHENSYYQVFLSHGVAFGLASGLTYVPSIGIAGHYFYKRRPLAVGIILCGAALGAVIHPIMLNKFFSGHIGFHNGVRISASLNTALLIVATLIARKRLPPKVEKKFPIASWLREPPYASLLVGSVFAFLGLFYPFFYLQLDAVVHGVDKKFAFYATSILNAASILGRCTTGLLAPYLGVLNLGTFTTFCTGIVIFCMLALRDKTSTILFAIFFGFFSGAQIASAPAMAAHHAHDPAELGVRMGLFFTVGGIVGLFATPIAGALLTAEYDWTRPVLFAGITMCLSGLFCGITRTFFAKRQATWRV